MRNKTINDLLRSLKEEKLLKAIAKTEGTKQDILDEKQKNRTEDPTKNTNRTKHKKRKKRTMSKKKSPSPCYAKAKIPKHGINSIEQPVVYGLFIIIEKIYKKNI